MNRAEYDARIAEFQTALTEALERAEAAEEALSAIVDYPVDNDTDPITAFAEVRRIARAGKNRTCKSLGEHHARIMFHGSCPCGRGFDLKPTSSDEGAPR